jgi:predicted ATPase/serine/threonine protein kinase
MTPERYEKVGQLFHAALELPRENRAAFLSGACAGDPELRREVESLVAAHDQAGDFVARPPTDVVANWLVRREEPEAISGRIGAYEVVSLLGRGGMGEVYLANDTRLGRKVAVKLLRPALTSNADAVRRFEQEARAASSLNHPNIVTIYEIGDLAERRFLAMEFVQGESLAAMIGRPIDVGTLARIGRQLARALSVAHAAGIVHRDIKPENVMVRQDGYVKVLDFGLARLVPLPAAARTHDTATSPSLILGTPRYMSPEQARGETATSASDVFSLGVVLYELATGSHPFESASTLATLHAIASRETPNPVHHVPDMPRSLQRLLFRMLEKSTALRPACADVEAELAKVAAGVTEVMEAAAAPGSGSRAAPRRDHNLPSQRTSLVGRATEIASIKSRLVQPGVRLMTLTGPGGTGKTRLAIQVAEDLLSHFEGGVAFVNLAPIADAKLVASAVARSLGVRESGDLPLVTAIAEHLDSFGRTLLLMDNFEQVSDAAVLVRELLDSCPALTVLATSRLVLHIYGEQEFPVPPLPLPAPGVAASPETLMEYASVALFVQRAAAGRPDFELTPKNASAVVDLCRRLDGLPLAIELAAARIKILPPSELLARIGRPLELLTGGARDLPERQQTLRQAIKWSYDLLTPPEQKLFRRLSVFAGGCTLEAAEAVCNTLEDLGMDLLEGVGSLVDNSLLVQRSSDGGEPRFVMLETFREYGRERLLEHGEAEATERAHAAYMLVVAEEETFDMTPPEREAWLRCCDAEHNNFRVAITSLIAAGNVEWALRLGTALFRFWEQRDHLTEGRESLARVLGMPGAEAPTRLRARALYCASVLSDIQSQLAHAEVLSHEACAIFQHFGDTNQVATTMTAMAWQAHRLGRHAEAMSLLAETVSIWESLGDRTAVDLARSNMASAAKTEGKFDLAWSLLQQVADSSRERGDQRGFASALNGLGDVAAAQGQHDAARRYHHESLERYQEIDDRWGIARVLADLASVDLQAHEYAAADRSLKEAVQAFRALGHQRGVARQLESLARCASCQSRDEDAVRLASAAAAIRHRLGAPAKRAERETIEHTLAQARERLSAAAYASAWKEGLSASLDRLLGLETAPRA